MSIKLHLGVLDRSHDETADLATKVFELSQTLQSTWVSAVYATRRRILEIVCLNCRLDGASAVFSTRKPFDVLIEGLYSEQRRGDRTGFELVFTKNRELSPAVRRIIGSHGDRERLPK